MGYYMRYIVTDTRAVDLSMIEAALRQLDPSYSIIDREAESGTLLYNSEPYGRLEVNRRGDDMFESELEELREEIEDVNGKMKRHVIDSLKNAKRVIALQVLFGERETEGTLGKIDPLWKWLFSTGKDCCKQTEKDTTTPKG